MDSNFEKKYLKYKKKYLDLKVHYEHYGGSFLDFFKPKNKSIKTFTFTDNEIYDIVSKNGLAISSSCFPNTIRENKEFAEVAILQNNEAFLHISTKLQSNENFIIKMVKKVNILKYVSDNLKKNKAVVLSAVQLNGLSLEFASEELKNDEDIVLAAVRQNGNALQFASDNMKKINSVVLEAVSQNGLSLQYASKELQADKDVVLAAVRKNGSAVQFASDSMKKDYRIISAARINDKNALQYIDPFFKQTFNLKIPETSSSIPETSSSIPESLSYSSSPQSRRKQIII